MSDFGAEIKTNESSISAEANVSVTSANDLMPNDSQSFNLIDGNDLLAESKEDEAASKSQDEVIEGTPQKEVCSPLKRPFISIQSSPKSEGDDTDDEPVAKMIKMSEIIPETQESKEDDACDDEPLSLQTKEIAQCSSHTGENIMTHMDSVEEFLTGEKVDNESFQALSQALETVLDDGDKMEVDENIKNTDNGDTEFNVVEKEDDTSSSRPVLDVQIGEVEQKEIEMEPSTGLAFGVHDINASNAVNDDSNVNQSNNTDGNDHLSKRSRMSIEVVYDKALAPPPKPKELVVLDDDGEKIILDSSNDDSDTNISSRTSKTLTTNSKHSETPESKMINGSDSTKSLDSAGISDESTITEVKDMKEKQPEVLNLISDSEGESFVAEDKSKKTLPVEKEINVLMKIKCLLHVDESSKELTNKEIINVYCENFSDFHTSRRRNSDTSNMADISDNKDPTSPASVTSNPQPYALNPRYSMMSLASSSSSSSSGSSKFPSKDNPFSLPRGVPKHAKKLQDPVADDSEVLKKEWKNINLISSTVVNFINGELITIDLHNGTNEDLERIMSSTPETSNQLSRSSKKVKVTKRRTQNPRSKSNGKASPEIIDEKEKKDDEIPSPSTPKPRSLGILRSYTPGYDPSDAWIGKKCFAKWSDNNYYPGIVVNKSKGKFKVNFLDGKNKLLIEDFVIPIPPTLPTHLSIYATTKNDDYGSCGMIMDIVKKSDDDNDILYAVETDEGEKLKVQLKDIFLTSDQVVFLKESLHKDIKSPHPEKISLDNLLEGSRRSKLSSTPKSSRANRSEPSSSGIKTYYGSESDVPDEDDLGGIQPEITGTLASPTKGPVSRVKGKGRSKKKVDDPETLSLLGPIPSDSIFKGMSFILTCASLESLDKYKSHELVDSNSELGTDYEEEWTRRPFIRERLITQITAGGGNVYESFEDIPKEEYKNVKLITNVPNVTAKSLLCLSAGIEPYGHQCIIRCCQANECVNLESEILPAGWSLETKSYIEMHKRPSNTPFQYIKVFIPKTSVTERSLNLWQVVIENAGGIVQFIESPDDDFIDGVAVLTNHKCPDWVIEKAKVYNIPLVSSTWIIQCLIEGQVVDHSSQQAYLYNYLN